VRSLLGHEAPGPHGPVSAGARLPPVGVDAVEDDAGVDGVRPRARRVLADRRERHVVPRERHRRLQPRQRRRVQARHHRHADRPRHRDGQVVQRVVVDDVEAVGAGRDQLEHELQVRVVLLHPLPRWGPDVLARGRAGLEHADLELLDVQSRVGAGSGEQTHLMATCDEPFGQHRGVRLEAALERLADREPARGDEADPHAAPLTGEHRPWRDGCERARARHEPRSCQEHRAHPRPDGPMPSPGTGFGSASPRGPCPAPGER